MGFYPCLATVFFPMDVSNIFLTDYSGGCKSAKSCRLGGWVFLRHISSSFKSAEMEGMLLFWIPEVLMETNSNLLMIAN